MTRRPDLRFRFRLAAHLGFASVRTMLASMTARELVQWEAFAEWEPFGWEHEHRLAGVVAATVANHAFGAAKRDRTPDSFIPQRERPRTTIAKSVAAVFGVPLRKRGEKGPAVVRKPVSKGKKRKAR